MRLMFFLLDFVVLLMEPEALDMLSKHSINCATSSFVLRHLISETRSYYVDLACFKLTCVLSLTVLEL